MASEVRAYKEEINNIFNLSLEAITRLNWEISSINQNNCLIKAQTKVSLLSWGEDIEIEIQQIQGAININMNSESRSQLIDWGKNDENINKFFSILESLITNIKNK